MKSKGKEKMIDILCEPPKTIAVNGTKYPICWDYRTWIKISCKIEDINFVSDDRRTESENIIIITEIIYLVFRTIINEPWFDSFRAILEFMRGYPTQEKHQSSGSHTNKKYFSFKYDINYIIIAIRNQSGLDLSYRYNGQFHWWDFMLEFMTLTGEHYISKIMGYRAYSGTDKELLKLKETYELPADKSEQAIIDEIDDLFYNS